MSGSETGVRAGHYFAKLDNTKTDKVLDTLIHNTNRKESGKKEMKTPKREKEKYDYNNNEFGC